jgi:hypothetical protein
MPGPGSPTPSWRSYDEGDVWTWILIVAGYAFALFFFRLIGGIDSAADAIQSWGRSSSERRLAERGESPRSYARSRLRRS